MYLRTLEIDPDNRGALKELVRSVMDGYEESVTVRQMNKQITKLKQWVTT